MSFHNLADPSGSTSSTNNNPSTYSYPVTLIDPNGRVTNTLVACTNSQQFQGPNMYQNQPPPVSTSGIGSNNSATISGSGSNSALKMKLVKLSRTAAWTAVLDSHPPDPSYSGPQSHSNVNLSTPGSSSHNNNNNNSTLNHGQTLPLNLTSSLHSVTPLNYSYSYVFPSNSSSYYSLNSGQFTNVTTTTSTPSSSMTCIQPPQLQQTPPPPPPSKAAAATIASSVDAIRQSIMSINSSIPVPPPPPKKRGRPRILPPKVPKSPNPSKKKAPPPTQANLTNATTTTSYPASTSSIYMPPPQPPQYLLRPPTATITTNIQPVVNWLMNQQASPQQTYFPPWSSTSSSISTPMDMSPTSQSLPLPLLPPSATLPMPPSFQEHYEAAHSSLETYKTFPVPPSSLEWTTLADLLAPSLVPLQIQQIVNPELWNRFVTTRKELFRMKSGDLSLLSRLGLDEKDVLRAAQISFNWRLHPSLEGSPYSDNLALLFHCTRSPANLDSILRQGLDERLGNSNSGGLLGRGIYFADNPQKSVQYDGGTGIILICAVLLGDCLSVDHLPNRNTFVREPEKGKEQKRNYNDTFFDSITGRPTGRDNEYVIYNRYQCVPLYQVQYQRGSNNPSSNANALQSYQRQSTPPIAWTPQQGHAQNLPFPNPQSGAWAFHARTIFTQMGVLDEDEEEKERLAEEEKAQEEERLDTLASLGFKDEDKNKRILAKYKDDLDRAVCHLLDEDTTVRPPRQVASSATSAEPPVIIDLSDEEDAVMAESSDPPPHKQKDKIAKIPTTTCTTPSEKDDFDEPLPKELSDWALDFDLGFATHPPTNSPDPDPSTSAPPTMEECPICCDEYLFDPTPHSITNSDWVVLTCSHKLCAGCHSQIETTRATMSGQTHTSIKCPFCQGNSGLEIGTCPNGTMTVTEMPSPCSGYEGYSTLAIMYSVNPRGGGGPHLNRTAYLPNTPEGRRILGLLRTAWDRRLCFTIGTSNTTGQENVLVWNIHHKTATSGGVASYGYPDPSYLERVGWELKAYGIE